MNLPSFHNIKNLLNITVRCTLKGFPAYLLLPVFGWCTGLPYCHDDSRDAARCVSKGLPSRNGYPGKQVQTLMGGNFKN